MEIRVSLPIVDGIDRQLQRWIPQLYARYLPGLYKASRANNDTGNKIVSAATGDSNLTWPNLSKYHDQAMTYSNSSWVYVAVDRKATAGALVSLNVYKQQGEGKKQLENHPLETLLRKPNPHQSQFEWAYSTLATLELTGNAYWFLSGSPPDQMWQMRPDRVRIVPGSTTDAPIKAYVYQVDGVSIPLDPSEVVHFTLYNPDSDYYGMSRLEAAQLAIQTDLGMQNWNRNYFGKNNAIPAGVLSVLSMVSDPELERIQTEWRQAYGGPERKTAIIRAGDAKWVDTSVNHRDMDFSGGRQFNKEEIFQIYAVPPGLLDKNATEANANAALELFTGNTVWPMMVSFCQKVTVSIAMPFYGEGIIVEPEDIRKKDAAAERAEIMAASMYLTINEIRKKYYDLDPRPDGNIYASGAGASAITGQPQMFDKAPKEVRETPGDAAIIEKEKQVEAGADKGPDPSHEPALNNGKALRQPNVLNTKQYKESIQFARYASKGKDVDSFTFKSGIPASTVLALKALADIPDSLEILLPASKIMPADQRRDKFGKRDPMADEKVKTANRLKKETQAALADLQTEVLRGVQHLNGSTNPRDYGNHFDDAWWKAALKALIAALYAVFDSELEKAAKGYADVLSMKLGVGYDPNTIADDTSDVTDDWDTPQQIVATTRIGLTALIKRWSSDQEGAEQDVLAQAVEDSPLFGADRADMIAETETTGLYAAAQGIGAATVGEELGLDSAVDPATMYDVMPAHVRCRCYSEDSITYNEQGRPVSIDYIWHTVQDERVCPTCDGYDGKLFSDIVGMDAG